jgi:hypothetical protein
MALAINISNTGQTTQAISLFSLGGTGNTDFISNPEAQTVQGNNVSTFIPIYWIYSGANNIWNLTLSYTIQFVIRNLATNTLFSTIPFAVPTGTNLQVASAIQSNLLSQGYNVNVILTLQYITPTELVVNYVIVNNEAKQYSYYSLEVIDGFDDNTALLEATNNLAYLSSNPNVISQQNVPLPVIQQSTIGYSYLIKSMYVVSTNPSQLIVPINYGTKDANGDDDTKILANTIDPNQPNSVAIRTNGMNDFIFDDSTVFQFDVLPTTNVSIKYEFEQLGYEEIKKNAIGIELRKEFARKEMLSQEKADDFQNFYFFE